MKLPIDSHLPGIRQTLDRSGAVIVVAPPGTGKTTRIPPHLTTAGKTLLLQPRRVAARALARRIAAERGWTVGQEVGWHIRFERRFGPGTRLIVATEGVLTARLQSDPLLHGFDTIILDEFHERSIHADLALALLKQAREARGDLRIVVMSATIDARPISAFLGDCPIVAIDAPTHPVEVAYAPSASVADSVLQRFPGGEGHILCFLPGAPEIHRVERELRGRLTGAGAPLLLPLYGALDVNAQEAALAPSNRRKVILATNVAETSLTIEGVTEVIDTGLHKVMRRDPATGLDRLDTERVSADSARQRAGRAGRTGPGHVLRLWHEHDELRPHREPEIERIDLARTALEILAWGDDPATFAWFEAPPATALDDALRLLAALGALEGGKLTEVGRQLCRVPLHPRLARLFLAAGAGPRAAAACACVSEGWRPRGEPETTVSDLLSLADRIAEAPHHVRRTRDQILRLAPAGDTTADDSDLSLLHAVHQAYADRLARRREPGSPRLLLVSGSGAELGRESGVREGEYLVAVDLVAGRRGPGSEARVRTASLVEPEWIAGTHSELVHRFDPASSAVRAEQIVFHGALELERRPAEPDPEETTRLLVQESQRQGPDEATAGLLHRLTFAGIEIDLDHLLGLALTGTRRLKRIDLASMLPYPVREQLNAAAPESIPVPSGRNARLDYRSDGSVAASVKLQELFGLADTPCLGPSKTPVTFLLLAPNGRPVQTTTDLRSFWNTTYPEVRKELRGRYPKHPWPEDPWTATATHRTSRRR